jgi:hypothetical protein
MTQFPTHSYFVNRAEEFHLYETLSTPMKLLSSLTSLIRYHISIFNTYKTLMKLRRGRRQFGRTLSFQFQGSSVVLCAPRIQLIDAGTKTPLGPCERQACASRSFKIVKQAQFWPNLLGFQQSLSAIRGSILLQPSPQTVRFAGDRVRMMHTRRTWW